MERAREPPGDGAETRLLALLLHLERRPWDLESGGTLEGTVAELERQGELIFPEVSTDWRVALELCLAAGWVSRQKEGIQLTAEGREQARIAYRAFAVRGFDDLLVAAVSSAAHQELCRLAFGGALGQLSPVDAHQLGLLEAVLRRVRPSHLVELGCGAGGLARWLVQRLGIRVTAADWAPRALDLAHRFGKGVEYRRLDIESLHLPAESVEVLLAVDVLAHLDDPQEVLRRGYHGLIPGGSWLLLGSELDTATSHFAGPLAKLGAVVQVVDLSRLEGVLWGRQAQALVGLRDVYEAEEHGALWRVLRNEAERGLRWASEGRGRRFLVWALKP